MDNLDLKDSCTYRSCWMDKYVHVAGQMDMSELWDKLDITVMPDLGRPMGTIVDGLPYLPNCA